jgi:hypothetical protein
MMALIALDGLPKRFGATRALDGVAPGTTAGAEATATAAAG